MFKKLSKSQLDAIYEGLRETDIFIPKGIFKGTRPKISEMKESELPEVKKLSGDSARLRIQNHIDFCYNRGLMIGSEKPNIPYNSRLWMNDNNSRCYYIEDNDGRIISFALYADMDFDPLGEFQNPVKLYVIHTRPDYRRKGYAEYLLNYTNKFENQVSAFTTGEECSVNLLLKMWFRTTDEILYRYRGKFGAISPELYKYLLKHTGKEKQVDLFNIRL